MIAVLVQSRTLMGGWFEVFALACLVLCAVAWWLEHVPMRTRVRTFAAAVFLAVALPVTAQIINCDLFPLSIECWWFFHGSPTTVDWEVQQTFNPF